MDKILESDIYLRSNSIYKELAERAKLFDQSNENNNKLEFEIKEDDEINGLSWSKGMIDHVEINSGVIELYYKYFSDVMNFDKRDFLSRLGIDEENAKEMTYEGVLFKDRKAVMYDSKFVDDEIAKLLEIFVSRFILLHEFGHIFNGHCELISQKSKMKTNFISMYHRNNEKNYTEEDALDIRTLEMDADAFATTQSILHLIFLYDNYETQVSIPVLEQMDIFYWWAFALRSHFLVCEDQFMDFNFYKKMTHLPSNLRFFMILLNAIQIMDLYKLPNDEKEEILKKLYKGANEAEKRFNEIKFTNYNLIDEVTNNQICKEYMNEVNAHWDEMRLQLEDYSRMPLFVND